MDEEELQAIEGYSQADHVPQLIAEVRRLRMENAALRELDVSRAELGHKNERLRDRLDQITFKVEEEAAEHKRQMDKRNIDGNKVLYYLHYGSWCAVHGLLEWLKSEDSPCGG